MKYAFIKGKDGKYRSAFYDKSGYLQLNCYAKDFNTEITVIGQYREPNAQELIEETK